MKKIIFVISFLSLFSSGCVGIGAIAVGADAAVELTFMVPGDKLKLDSGDVVYVDNDGMLRGIDKVKIVAAGRKIRDVLKELAFYKIFERFSVIAYGKRYIDVAGDVRNSGRYSYPKDELWNMMNVMTKAEGFNNLSDKKQYLLIRNSWIFPHRKLFIRGEAVPVVASAMGGDDLLIMSGDLIIFPGEAFPVYIYGAVKSPVCFVFNDKKNPPKLKDAIEKAGYIFKLDKKYRKAFEKGLIPSEVAQIFLKNKIALSKEATIKKMDISEKWILKDKGNKFTIIPEGSILKVHKQNGFLNVAHLDNIYVYRVLKFQKQRIYNLRWKNEQDFALKPWDIIYVPFKSYRNIIKK